LLVLAATLAILALGTACSDDDDSSDEDERVEEQTDDSDSDDNDDEESRSDDEASDDSDDVDTSPSDGSEYLGVYTDIANDLQDEFAEECVDAIDIGSLDFSDVEFPEECEDYFDEFASRLDEVDPPDSCSDLHDLLLGLLESLAAGETDAFEDLLGGDDDQPSEGIVSASVDCSGI
jgi:hypothetical protein